MRRIRVHTRGLMLIAVLILCMTMGTALAQQAEKKFTVAITWVNGAGAAPADLSYDYFFVEQASQERHQLHIDAMTHRLPSPDGRIKKAAASIMLPVRNSLGQAAVYGLSPEGLGTVEIGGVHYAVSTSESADPKAGAPYDGRYRLLSQQMQPKAQVVFQGVDPQDFTLTLRMQSWAMNAQGTARAQHAASRTVSGVGEEGIDLFALFSQPEDITAFRHFVLAELAWDEQRIAGENRFTLEVEQLPGLSTQVSGSAAEGFHILITKAP